MLGETVREHRVRKGLTQARLARLAGVSRRHLAALEKGANVSVNVLQKVAVVLELKEISLGNLTVQTGARNQALVNVPLLADTLREAHAETLRAESLLARAEGLVGGGTGEPTPLSFEFPKMPVRRADAHARGSAADRIADETSGLTRVRVAGEVRQGEPETELSDETVLLPASLIEHGEIVLRARGDQLRDHNIEDGDLLVIELRQKGRAASGELVIAKIGNIVWIGRWWQKHGQKALMSNGLSEVMVGASKRSLKVMAAINQIIRPK
jgi:transcriptional regulator with XRE-family HTH domain